MKKIFLALGVLALMGAGCAGGAAPGSSSGGAMMEDVPAFDAPSDWGTLRADTYNVNYPPEYTSDLDFDTLENVISNRETGEELIRISKDENGEPVFTKVADDVPFFDEIVGSTELK